MDKNLIRKISTELRKQLNQIQASEKIVNKIAGFENFLCAKNVLIYYPLQNEINLLKLCNKYRDKNFYLPRVKGEILEICPFEGELKKSSFKIMEPVCPKIDDLSIIDIAFIPALAVDKKLNRVGYGKGYYDRLFSQKDFKAFKVAVINKELCNFEITAQPYDKKIDLFITD